MEVVMSMYTQMLGTLMVLLLVSMLVRYVWLVYENLSIFDFLEARYRWSIKCLPLIGLAILIFGFEDPVYVVLGLAVIALSDGIATASAFYFNKKKLKKG
jgi:hypothetical protein